MNTFWSSSAPKGVLSKSEVLHCLLFATVDNVMNFSSCCVSGNLTKIDLSSCIVRACVWRKSRDFDL